MRDKDPKYFAIKTTKFRYQKFVFFGMRLTARSISIFKLMNLANKQVFIVIFVR